MNYICGRSWIVITAYEINYNAPIMNKKLYTSSYIM